MGEDFQPSLMNGKYRLVSTLGQGGMGVVYLADELDEHGAVERQVALKTILPEWSSDRAFTERFEREVKAMKRNEHRHIVTVYDSGRDEQGNLYYTMPYIKAPTLKQVFTQGALPVPRATAMAIQICDALAMMHEHGIVHRDLKPANIFVEQEDGTDFVRIGDFGIAKMIDDATTVLHHQGEDPPPIGTPRYMAPEQWQWGAIDGRTDLYALGIMLYEMLTGKPPFSGNRITLREQHLNGAPPPLQDLVTPQLARIVTSLLKKDPDQRPPDARQVRQQLEGIDLSPRRQAPEEPMPTEIFPAKVLPRSTRSTLPLLIATVGIVGILIFLFSSSFRGRPERYSLQAIQQWREAAERGDVVAQFNLGVIYDQGQGVVKDAAEALRWYRKAAEQGYAGAQNNLGTLYLRGQGVTQNVAEAMRWYRQAAEQGYAAAQNNLGTLYLQGQGVSQDVAEAQRWYRKAAEQGYPPAQVNLGDVALRSKNYREAMRWYLMAAEQGEALAEFKLGTLYDQGLGVTPDKSKALEWYKKAAARGQSDAQKRYQQLMGMQ